MQNDALEELLKSADKFGELQHEDLKSLVEEHGTVDVTYEL
jgi:hypothetical protein